MIYSFWAALQFLGVLGMGAGVGYLLERASRSVRHRDDAFASALSGLAGAALTYLIGTSVWAYRAEFSNTDTTLFVATLLRFCSRHTLVASMLAAVVFSAACNLATTVTGMRRGSSDEP